MVSAPAPELEAKWSDDQRGEWYSKAVEYWDRQEASVDGVLGGFGHVSDADIDGSRRFLLKVYGPQLKAATESATPLVALDCGAGIGRVSEQLLLHLFDEVDLVEPSRHLLDTARQRLGSSSKQPFPAQHRAVGFFQAGLQVFTPAAQRYNIIWTQWCLLYLTDEDVLEWLRKCAAALRPGGLVILKENICASGFVIDEDDSSLTRSDAYLQDLIRQSAMTLVCSQQQRNFPADLFKVRMYALKPR